MKLIARSIRNVLRSPLRLLLVVALLGGSLAFVAAMAGLTTSSQQELAAVRKQIGTTITIEYAPQQGGGTTQSGGPGQKNGNGQAATPVSIGNGVSVAADQPHISNSMVTKIKATQGVTSTQERIVRPYTETGLKGEAANGLPPLITVNGTSLNSTAFTLSGGVVPTLVAGRSFRDSDASANVAMMSQALAQANHLNVGSTFTLNGTTFTLIGLYTTSNQYSDNTVVIPLVTLQKVFHFDSVDSVTVNVASYKQVNAVAARLRTLLGQNFNVTAQADQYNNVFDALQVAQNSIQAALVASFLIAAAVIIFAVLMLVRERTAEIAILKTIGASHVQVLRQFWTEILTLSITGSALAVLLIVVLGPFLSHVFDIDASSLVNADAGGPSIDHPLIMTNGVTTSTTSTTASNLSNIHLAAVTLNVQTLLIILGVGIGLALLTSFIPTWFVARLKPAEVLRKA